MRENVYFPLDVGSAVKIDSSAVEVWLEHQGLLVPVNEEERSSQRSRGGAKRQRGATQGLTDLRTGRKS
jgi:hypothetical protein